MKIFWFECKFCIFTGGSKYITNERIGSEDSRLGVNFVFLMDLLEI